MDKEVKATVKIDADVQAVSDALKQISGDIDAFKNNLGAISNKEDAFDGLLNKIKETEGLINNLVNSGSNSDTQNTFTLGLDKSLDKLVELEKELTTFDMHQFVDKFDEISKSVDGALGDTSIITKEYVDQLKVDYAELGNMLEALADRLSDGQIDAALSKVRGLGQKISDVKNINTIKERDIEEKSIAEEQKKLAEQSERDAMQSLKDTIHNRNVSLEKEVETHEEWVKRLNDIINNMPGDITFSKKTSDEVDALNNKLNDLGSTFEVTLDKLTGGNETIVVFDELNNSIQGTTKQLEDFYNILDYMKGNSFETDKGLSVFSASSVGDGVELINIANDKLKDTASTFEYLKEHIKETGDSFIIFDEGFNNSITVSKETLDKFGNSFTDAKETSIGFKDAVVDIEKDMTTFDMSMSNVVNTIDEAGNSINEAFSDQDIEIISNDTSNLDKIVGSISDKALDIIENIDIISVITGGIKKGWEELNNTFEEVLNTIKDISIDSLVGTFELINDIIKGTVELTEELATKLYGLADEGEALQQKWFSIYNYLGSNGGNELLNYFDEVSERYGIDTDNMLDSVKSVSAVIQNLGVDAEDSMKALTALENFTLDVSAFTGIDINSLSNQLQQTINMGYLGRNSAIVKALNLTDADVEQFKNLNTQLERTEFILQHGEGLRNSYARWLDTSAGKVTMFKQAISSLQGNMQRLGVGIFAKVAPYITAVIRLINTLVVKINSLLGISVDSATANNAQAFSGFSKSINNTASDMDKLTDNTKKNADATKNNADAAKKAADDYKKAERSLLSFDDVIQLNDNSDDNTFSDDDIGSVSDFGDELADVGDELGDIELGALGLSDIFDAWQLDDWNKGLDEFGERIKTIGEELSNGQFYAAGMHIAELVTDILNDIPWDKIQDLFKDIGEGVARFLNGIFDDRTLFETIGSTIANAINTLVLLIHEFVTNLHWDQIGADIAASWKSFWDTFDSTTMGDTLGGVVKGIFDTFSTFVSDMWSTDENGLNGFNIAGIKIADVINNFFSNFSEEDVKNAADSIIDFIDGVFETLDSFISTLDTTDILNKVTTFLTELFTKIGDNAESWGATIGKFVDLVIGLIRTVIDTYDTTDLRSSIQTFILNSKIGELIGELLRVKLRLWWESICLSAPALLIGGISGILAIVNDKAISKWLDTVKELMTGNIGGIVMDVNSWFASLFGIDLPHEIDLFKESVIETVTNMYNTAAQFIHDIPENFASGMDIITGLLNDGANKVSEFFAPVFDWLTEKIDWIKEKIAGVKSSFSDFTSNISLSNIGSSIKNIFVPKLASGGIVERAQLALVGEAGREAVVPLENNTGWMDTMASKINDKLNVNSNNSNIRNININVPNKTIYTRSELLELGRVVSDSLQLYGVTVSMS